MPPLLGIHPSRTIPTVLPLPPTTKPSRPNASQTKIPGPGEATVATSSTSSPPSIKRTRAAAPCTPLPPHTQSPAPHQVTLRDPFPRWCYERQPKACQAYREPSAGFEKCVSCIEKQSILGGCRFVGIRAFKVLQDESKDEAKAADEEMSRRPRRRKKRMRNH
ncbi:hypothetical protein BGX38DRAFT_1281207 [Terfezia claveryi]|nr:hypothetical protein BGX38DRAFT_1281207 [Terfezia claveryi]